MGEFVAYYRVSTERRLVIGPGLESQREAGAIRPFIAAAMNGAQLLMAQNDFLRLMSGPPAGLVGPGVRRPPAGEVGTQVEERSGEEGVNKAGNRE
jgi:hypothetical protein